MISDDSFYKVFLEDGALAGLIPIKHKLSRATNLVKLGEQYVNDESMRDILLDMSNYCMMLVMVMDKKEETQIKEE